MGVKMDIICKECGMVYTGNDVPAGLTCLCKSKEFKITKGN